MRFRITDIDISVRETDEKPSFILQNAEKLFYIFPVSTDDEANSKIQRFKRKMLICPIIGLLQTIFLLDINNIVLKFLDRCNLRVKRPERDLSVCFSFFSSKQALIAA